MLRYILLVSVSLIGSIGAGLAEECDAPDSIKHLSKIDPPKFLMPLPDQPGQLPRDCPFYQQAWQTFLFVTQKAKGGKPAFLGYPTFEKLFKKKATPLFAAERPGTLSLAPRGVELPNAGLPPDSDLDLNDILQAAGSSALQKVLIDQNGNAVWYTIQVNQSFADFLKDYNLTDPAVLKKIPVDLEFRPGLIELKSAWQIVEGGAAPKNYITTAATIPIFKVDANGKIVPDGDRTRYVTVALLSLHVVTLIEGHPEFIWATFEHVTHKDSNNWIRDVAPAATDNPDKADVKVEIKLPKYSLYPVNSAQNPAADSNKGNKLTDLKLDVKTQKFLPLTPVYRIFPASKCDSIKEDEELQPLNDAVRGLFQKPENAGDVRSNYQLVCAIWLNTPRVDFKAGQAFSDVPPFPDTCKPDATLFGGENRLSNMALESFTQPTNRQPNCFGCHDTRTGGMVNTLPISRLNVSHVLSKFFDLQSPQQ